MNEGFIKMRLSTIDKVGGWQSLSDIRMHLGEFTTGFGFKRVISYTKLKNNRLMRIGYNRI